MNIDLQTMRRNSDVINAELRTLFAEMAPEDLREFLGMLYRRYVMSKGKEDTIVNGLALSKFLDVIANLAELKEMEA